MTTDKFTPEEKALLKRFVTNVDGPIFVLSNLPEVIKGALFSRYSRSTKGLRRLLIDDFLNNPEGGFGVDAAGADARDEMLDLAKAQDFYDRILDGYGDDSIAELGGAHLALEQVSNIATKEIEDCRIGGSPLEKSSRYVRFDQKVNGKFQYYREPRIMESKHADSYIEMMDSLFKTYSGLVEPMSDFVRERLPRKEGTPKWAYNASVRACALDSLRGLLPASTLTNMGLFGNGRFFEAMLIKLKTHPLREMNTLGDFAQEELDKVIPSFVRRAKRSYHHFSSMAQHRSEVRGAMQEVAAQLPHKSPSDKESGVVLVEYDQDGEDQILAAALYPELHLSFPQLLNHVRTLSAKQRDRILDSYLAGRTNRRHKPGRALEHVHYTFDITADFGAYRDLQRHRMLTQQRQLLSTQHGYEVPELVRDAGLELDYKEVMDRAVDVYGVIASDMPQEAQYAVPFGYRIRWYFTINLRALVWLCELRSMPQGHPSYRRIVQQMFLEVKSVHPRLARCFKFVDLKDYPLGRLKSEVQQEKKKQVLSAKG